MKLCANKKLGAMYQGPTLSTVTSGNLRQLFQNVIDNAYLVEKQLRRKLKRKMLRIVPKMARKPRRCAPSARKFARPYSFVRNQAMWMVFAVLVCSVTILPT
jgi:hypothetical protein